MSVFDPVGKLLSAAAHVNQLERPGGQREQGESSHAAAHYALGRCGPVIPRSRSLHLKSSAGELVRARVGTQLNTQIFLSKDQAAERFIGGIPRSHS